MRQSRIPVNVRNETERFCYLDTSMRYPQSIDAALQQVSVTGKNTRSLYQAPK